MALELLRDTRSPGTRYVVLVYVEMLYMNYPRCGNCAFSRDFVREWTDVSLSDVAGEVA